MTCVDYHQTISSKVQGTQNLHEVAVSRGAELDHFILLSSISGLLGQKGQANYAAANVFLDAFASYRHGLGLRAMSVNLGVIEDVGYVANQGGMTQHFDPTLWSGINEAALKKIFELALLEQAESPRVEKSPQLVTGITIPHPQHSPLVKDARFGALFLPQTSGVGQLQADPTGDKELQIFVALLKSGTDRKALLEPALELVNKHLVKALRLYEALEPGKPLSDYGLDSLAAVEFRNWVRQDLKADLTALEINASPSLRALCEKIATRAKP